MAVLIVVFMIDDFIIAINLYPLVTNGYHLITKIRLFSKLCPIYALPGGENHLFGLVVDGVIFKFITVFLFPGYHFFKITIIGQF